MFSIPIAPKILVIVPHYFSDSSVGHISFGSDDFKNIKVRKSLVESCYSELARVFKKLEYDYEIFRLGINGYSLMELDLEVKTKNSKFLPWIAMDYAYQMSESFDLIVVIEDDIFVNEDSMVQLVEFNSKSELDSILIANRVEQMLGQQFCTDLVAMPGWKSPSIKLEEKRFREPINIHSGLLLLNKEKFKLAYERRPFKEPTIIIGDYMASAFANMHAFFRIYRALPTSTEVTVLHLDSWVKRQIDLNPQYGDVFQQALELQKVEFN